MGEVAFWELINLCVAEAPPVGDDVAPTYERLVQELARCPIEDIHLFGLRWDEAMSAAYRVDLWGAGYLINGGLGDDSFMDLRSRLILHGEKVFRAALADPDSLVDVVSRDQHATFEGYPDSEAWRRVNPRSSERA